MHTISCNFKVQHYRHFTVLHQQYILPCAQSYELQIGHMPTSLSL